LRAIQPYADYAGQSSDTLSTSDFGQVVEEVIELAPSSFMLFRKDVGRARFIYEGIAAQRDFLRKKRIFDTPYKIPLKTQQTIRYPNYECQLVRGNQAKGTGGDDLDGSDKDEEWSDAVWLCRL